MEQIVGALIEYDKDGQELVRKAKEHQLAELGRMEEYKQAIYQKHREHLAQDLERFAQEAAAEQDERLADLQREQTEKMETLRRMYRENNEQWVAQMAARCTAL